MSADQPSDEARDRLVELLADCRDDPDLFNAVILRRPPYWSGRPKGHHGQLEWCDELVKYRKLAIETGNMLGKDYWVGGIVPWWLLTRPNSLVVVTGPSQTLLGTVTWKEIRRAAEGSPFDLGLKISAGAKASPLLASVDGAGWQAIGYSTTSVERASGQHAKDLLVIVEEASGVEPDIWAAIESLGYSKLVAIGNPIRATGGFVELCDEAARDAGLGLPPSESCRHVNVPSTAGPDADFTEAELAASGRKTGLATKTWIEGQRRKYGENSPIYRRQVLAIRPAVSHEALFPVERLDACTSDAVRELVAGLRARGPGGRRRLGCDVGEGVGKSRSVVVVRDDLGILEVSADAFKDADDTAREMVRLGAKWAVYEADWSYDGNGSTGLKIKKALAKLGIKRAREHKGSDGGLKHATNLRTACALAFERRLDPLNPTAPKRPPGDGLPSEWAPFAIDPGDFWEGLREELLALKAGLKGAKSELQRKEDLAAELGHSPDYADALLMTFHEEARRGD